MTTGLDMPEPGSRRGGRYTLLDRLGAGVAGEVWRGRDETTGAACAVKLLRPELVQDDGALARMRATIAWIGQITHPGIVAVDEVLEHDGTVTLISRLVPGESLRALLDRQGTLPTGAAFMLASQLCDALAAARRVGVAHGDVKPSNILLEPDPETQIALRLTDFGMAALLGRAVVQQAANSNPVTAYAAPELGAGEAPTEAADIYATAVVLYESLTGQPPFEAVGLGQARREAPAGVPLPANLPATAADALAACLDEDPRHRPSAVLFGAALRRAAEEIEAGARTQSRWPVVAVAAGPDLSFLGGGEPAPESESGDSLLPARADRRETAVVRRPGAAAVIVSRSVRPVPAPARATRPWTIVAAALCGIALAVFITFGLTTHGSPRASASTLPARVAVIGPTAAPTSRSSVTADATSTLSPTASATSSSSATATPSPFPDTPSAPVTTSAANSPSPGPPSSARPPVSYTGRLLNPGTGKCLDTSGGYFANGVVEQIWDCDNGIGQVFTLTAAGQLTVDGGRYCLDDATSANATGTRAMLWTCGGQPHQRWTARSDGSFAGGDSGLCLDVPGPDNGTQLDYEPCDGQPHQHWSWN